MNSRSLPSHVFALAQPQINNEWLVPPLGIPDPPLTASVADTVETGASVSFMLLCPSFGSSPASCLHLVSPGTGATLIPRVNHARHAVLPIGSPNCVKFEMFLVPRAEAANGGILGEGYVAETFSTTEPMNTTVQSSRVSGCRFVTSADASEVLVYTWYENFSTIVSWIRLEHAGMRRRHEHIEFYGQPVKDMNSQQVLRRVYIDEQLECAKCAKPLTECPCAKPVQTPAAPGGLLRQNFREKTTRNFLGIFNGNVVTWISPVFSEAGLEQKVSGVSKCIVQASSLARRNIMKAVCLKIYRDRYKDIVGAPLKATDMLTKAPEKPAVAATHQYPKQPAEPAGPGGNKASLDFLMGKMPISHISETQSGSQPEAQQQSGSSEDSQAVRVNKMKQRAERNRELARVSNEKRRVRIQGMEAELIALRGSLGALQSKCEVLQAEKAQADYENQGLRNAIEVSRMKYNDELNLLRSQCEDLQRLNFGLYMENTGLKSEIHEQRRADTFSKESKTESKDPSSDF